MCARRSRPVLGLQATACDLVARGVIAGRAITFTLTRDGSFAPDDGGRVRSDTTLRRLAAVPGLAMAYTCLAPGWLH